MAFILKPLVIKFHTL